MPPRHTPALLTSTALVWGLCLPVPVPATAQAGEDGETRYPVVRPIAGAPAVPGSDLVLKEVRGMDTGADGTAYLADTAAGAVYAVAPDGAHTLVLGGEEAEPGFQSPDQGPRDVAVTDDGTVSVLSNDGEEVSVAAASPEGDPDPVFTVADHDDRLSTVVSVAAEGDTVYVGDRAGNLWAVDDGSEPEQLLDADDLPDLTVTGIDVDAGTVYLATRAGLVATDAAEGSGTVRTVLDEAWLEMVAFVTDDREVRGVAVHDGTAAVVTGTGITVTDLEDPEQSVVQPAAGNPAVAIDQDGRMLATSGVDDFPGTEALWELTTTDTLEPWPGPAEPGAPRGEDEHPPGSVTTIPSDEAAQQGIAAETEGELHATEAQGWPVGSRFSHERLRPIARMWVWWDSPHLNAGDDGSVVFAQQMWAHRMFPDGSVQTVAVDEPGEDELDWFEAFNEYNTRHTALGTDVLYAAQPDRVVALSPEHGAEEVHHFPDDSVRVAGLVVDDGGTLYVSERDYRAEQGRLLRFGPDGEAETVLGHGEVDEDEFTPGALAVDREGTVYLHAVTSEHASVLRVGEDGTADTIASADDPDGPMRGAGGLVVDGDGNLRASGPDGVWTVHGAAAAPAERTLPLWAAGLGGLAALVLVGVLARAWSRSEAAGGPEYPAPNGSPR